VVVTGDHGEAFGHPHPMMGHGNGLFDENMRVPLLFWSPALFEGGRREVKPAGHVDVNPTIAHLLGVQPPADWQGCSLLSPEHPGRVYMLSDRDGFQFGVVDGMRKAILYATAGYDQLFDLANDPLELDNLSKKMPEVSAQLRTRISAFIQFEEKYLNGEGPAGTGPKIEKRR
jgi:arylsulfatase A-like enzyme